MCFRYVLILLFILSFCTLVFVAYYEPLQEMVKKVMPRAHDALSSPSNFTQTWVDGAPRRRRLIYGGHPEMDEPYFVCDPVAPFLCLILYLEFWLYVYVCALDKNEMNAMSNTTFKLLFLNCSLICSEMVHMPLICSKIFYMSLICSKMLLMLLKCLCAIDTL